MKFSENWLREWVDPAVDSDRLCWQLTMAGLEVDAVEPAGPALKQVVVGVIDAVSPHSDAERLTVCDVDCGIHGRRRIVCGAPNARPGLRAPVALPGARLPAGLVVAATQVRGIVSQGMLCAADELGLGDDHVGLMELDAEAVTGAPLTAHLGLADRVLEIDLTPNRGDCFSILGVAREVGVWNGLPVTTPAITQVGVANAPTVAVAVADRAACPVYAGRVVQGLDVNARSPDWLREKLRRGGIRAVFPVVDVTNYVMLELGQPMHAFDAAQLAGNISVRYADPGESLELLDETRVQLDASTLVIADDHGPVAMAGVMGGARTGVGSDTGDVFLESACFAPRAVAGQGRRYKLHTDSLHRFERGVDPGLQQRALERATALIQSIAGGTAGPITLVEPDGDPTPAIRLRQRRVANLLGAEIPADEIADILQRLEMTLIADGDDWWITPPSHRYDLAVEADLIEEIARIHGYSNLPTRGQRAFVGMATNSEREQPVAAYRAILRQRGYDEAVTYSFVDAALQARLAPDAQAIDLDNPIAKPLAQMRTTLWSGLIPCWLHNLRRQQRRIRLYEYGLRFTRYAGAPLGVAQLATVAGLIAGPAEPEHWQGHSRKIDFFDLKGDVEALLAGGAAYSFAVESHPALHPGRSARVYVDNQPVGWLGQLHPLFLNVLDIKELPYLFELDYGSIHSRALALAATVPEFPEVRRDLALVIPDYWPVGDLVQVFESAGEPLLQSIVVFDLFSGGDLDTGFKSVALGLIFQDKTSTLESREVEHVVGRLLVRAEKHCGARVRGQKDNGTDKSRTR